MNNPKTPFVPSQTSTLSVATKQPVRRRAARCSQPKAVACSICKEEMSPDKLVRINSLFPVCIPCWTAEPAGSWQERTAQAKTLLYKRPLPAGNTQITNGGIRTTETQ